MGRKKSFKEAIMGIPLIYRWFQKGITKPSTTNYLVAEVIQPEPGMTILDVGCGVASIRQHLGNVQYIGVDHNSKYIAKAREKYGAASTFHVADISDVAKLTKLKFERILLLGVLHHLSDAQCTDLLQKCAPLLARSGHLVAFDCTLTENQHPVARILAKADRGRYVRPPDHYKRLLKQSFESVNVIVRHDLLRVPYSHTIITARN